MELKRLEILGFKSFPEKITVEFSQGVTAIVGPNGSGKSNIADAVRWVLGEQSAKTLRGSRMEDVIFNGTDRRRPMGYAQVTLVLDNSDRSLPVDYDEVSIRRRLFRSGESEYAINDGRCRLKDVQELLMDTGIGKDGYSLIGQGQIDQLLSSKPQERRLVFEEASGITKYKTRREEAEKELEEERQRLTRVSDVLSEIEGRLGPLKEQAETAKVYLDLKQQLNVLEVSSFVGEYEQLQAQKEKADASLKDLQAQMEEAQKKRSLVKERSQKLADQSGQQSSHLQELNETLSQCRIDREKADGEERMLLAQHEQEVSSQKTLTESLNESKETIRERTKTLDAEKKKSRQLEAEKKEADQKLAEKQTELQKLRETAEELEAQVKDDRLQTAAASESLSEARMKLEAQALAIRQDEQQSSHEEENRQRLIDKRDASKARLQEVEEEASKAQVSQGQAETLAKEKTQRVQSLQEQLSVKKQEQQTLMLSLKDQQKRLSWMEGMESSYEGYSGPVRSVMKLKGTPQGRGIHGTVSDILSVDRKLTAAAESALGAALQNIVVDDADTAKRLIEYLRQHNGGRATFLPVESVFGRSANRDKETILAMPGVIGFMNDLAGYDPQYQKIVDRLLGNTVAAEDFDSAAAVSRRFGQYLRVVTLEGDMFNAGGSITGGSRRKEQSGLLSRRGEMDELRGQMEESRKKADTLFQEASEIERQLSQERQALTSARSDLEKCQQISISSQAELEREKAALSEWEHQLDALEKGQEGGGALKKQHLADYEVLKKDVEEKEKAAGEAAEKEKEAQERLSATQAKISQAREEEGRIQVQSTSLYQQMAFIERSIEWESSEIEKLSSQADEWIEKRQAISEKLKRFEEEKQKIASRKKELDEQADRLEQALKDQRLDMDKTNEEREKNQQESEELLTAYAALEKEQVRLENQSSKAEKDLADLNERMWNDYEITYGAARELSQDEKLKEASALSRTKRRQMIGQLKSQMKELGAVNENAVTEYKSLSERYEFLTRQRSDILKSEENLEGVIERMTKQMEKQFREGFAAIEVAFDKVFQQIFGGGHGVLRLEDEGSALESGIEIIGQPPGKKVQNMNALSGGERALTAIALLFAIQQQHPAPFCILDEIEAALDDINVERFAHYLKTMSKTTQFIVITHRKGTMLVADTMYGVTMEEKGVSKCISVKFA